MADEQRPFITVARRDLRWGGATICLCILAMLVALTIMFSVYRTANAQVDKLIEVNKCRARASAESEAVLLESVALIAQRQSVDVAAIQAAAEQRRASVETCETAKENP